MSKQPKSSQMVYKKSSLHVNTMQNNIFLNHFLFFYGLLNKKNAYYNYAKQYYK